VDLQTPVAVVVVPKILILAATVVLELLLFDTQYGQEGKLKLWHTTHF
jgi:hypothetical protein